MSSILKKISNKANSDSDEEPESSSMAENTLSQPPKTTLRAARGLAAALLAKKNNNSEDSDSDDNGKITSIKNKMPIRSSGIYSMKINQTKNEIKKIHNKFEYVDSKKLLFYSIKYPFTRFF